MNKIFVSVIAFLFSSICLAADGDTVWFFQSFTDVSHTVTTDMNVRSGLADLCRKKQNTDLRSISAPDYSGDESAFGHTIGDYVDIVQASDTIVQCQYNSGPELNDNIYYLYIYAETKCDEGSEYDRKKRSCVAKFECEVGEAVLLAGTSAPLVQTSPNTVYIADSSPQSTCRSVQGTSKACIYSKPAYTHSCYADSALSWDASGNMQGSGTGHCNYQYVNSGTECTDTSGAMAVAWGGYSLTAGSSEFTCADGITSPGCPGETGDGSGGGETGSGGSGGGETGSGGSGGTGGGNGDDGSGGESGGGSDTGSGGSGSGENSSGSVSGTACGATLSCSGDAIQCAILAQQKKAACALSDLTQADQSAIKSMLTGEKFELEEKTIQATSLFERARFLPSACPSPEVLTLSYGAFTIPYDSLCNFVDKLSFLIVLMASLMGMLIVFKD